MRKPVAPVRQPARPAGKPAPAKPAAKPTVKPATAKAALPKPAPANKVAAPKRSARASEHSEKRDQKRQIHAISRAQIEQVRRFTSGSRLKRGIIFSAVGSVLALVALVLATIFTPMLAIDKIEIVGLHRLKTATVQNAVKGLIGTPLTTVDENQIEQRLKAFTLIESFTTVSLPPHTLQLYIRERAPIGVVTVGATSYLYDPAGVQIAPAKATSKYPTILVNGNPAHSSSYREAVSVLLALPASLYPKVYSIQATSVDDVRIRLRGVSNRQIVWGDSSQSMLKSKVLAALLANVKRTQSAIFDVSSPTAPTVRYGSF